jgi:protoporphyrinogen oxidase
MRKSNTRESTAIILGGGVSGLAAGYASGLPVFEAQDQPGGICASYHLKGYRFEVGGGHWIFGGDPFVHSFLDRLTPMTKHQRISGVWFPADQSYVPYPLQNHLRFLPPATAKRALKEMTGERPPQLKTMRDWLAAYFGPTLCKRFFWPFHDLYTAGLYRQIAPQDSFKSPVDLAQVRAGAQGTAAAVGYNTTYLYPAHGLDVLMKKLADGCDMRYQKTVVAIDLKRREVQFADGTGTRYTRLICTLPLNRTLELANLQLDKPAPYTSVLVLNIGALKGPRCPQDHWLYHPTSHSGFHRVGFYSNVDPSFLPKAAKANSQGVSIYVERAFPGGQKPSTEEITLYRQRVIEELQQWGFIQEVHVADPTWIDVAYTWAWPGSNWRAEALQLLQDHNVFMVGRYARWTFQGIAESIRDGFVAGSSFRQRARD